VDQPQYGDFILDLEFKPSRAPTAGCSSNLGYQRPGLHRNRIQVAAMAPDRPLARGSVGGIYDLVAPSVNAVRVDDWNRYIITAQGPNITVVLNGQQVSEANLDQWTQVGMNPTARRTSSSAR
jgi:hypothetical protein